MLLLPTTQYQTFPFLSRAGPKRVKKDRAVALLPLAYSHSMVPGGLLVMSYTTRFTEGTSLMMRLEMRSSTS